MFEYDYSNWNNNAEFWVDGSCTGGSAPYENIVYTGEYQDTWVGRIGVEIPSNPSDPNHQAQSFDIYINQRLCDSEGTNYKQSVMSHEIGHAFGLDHSTATAIMNHSRDRNTVYIMQSDDISGLNASW